MIKGTISNITEQVIANVDTFKQRQLEIELTVIYLDATYIPLRRDTVSKEAVHIALGIKIDGSKELLGYVINPNEAISASETLLLDLKSRGLTKPLLFITDGLKGIEDTILSVYPKADIQRCLVHVMRNIAWKVRVSDRTAILDDFKIIRKQNNKADATKLLNDFISKWGKTYPKVIDSLSGNKYLLTFFDYPEAIRSSIYTTNPIESFNKHLKRKFKSKIQFQTEKSLEKCLVSLNFKGSSRIFKGFGLALGELKQKLIDKCQI